MLTRTMIPLALFASMVACGAPQPFQLRQADEDGDEVIREDGDIGVVRPSPQTSMTSTSRQQALQSQRSRSGRR
jgi:hypothetical protein